MATKAERKAEARAERIAREHAQAAAAQRRSRLLRLGGVVLVAVIAVIVAIAISSSSGGKKASTTPSSQAPSAVNRLLAGIPQSGNTLGHAKAPVEVTVYEDLECPICREFTLGAGAELIAKDVRDGRVKVVFRSLQTATPDTTTFQVQQQAAIAAGKQQRLWHYVELFYHQQGQEGTAYVTESYLDKLARQVPGLNYSAWVAARKAGLGGQVSADEALAQGKGFNSTPTIVVRGPKGAPAPVAGAIDYAALERMVTEAGG
jgi:protein-disulfide isomerase